MKSHTFLLANLISTGVISLVMYDLAHPPLCNYIRSNILTSLRIYYKHKSLIELVLYAVIHKIVIVSFAMLITTFVFSFRTWARDLAPGLGWEPVSDPGQKLADRSGL